MSDARKKLFDIVLVWRFDRFARSSRHLAVTLEEFNSLGINFISYSENINLDSPMGKAMFTIISAMAQLECDIVSERVKAALRNAKANGKKFGRPPLDENTRIKIKELRAQGESIRNIAVELKIGKSSVERYIKKRLLKLFKVVFCSVVLVCFSFISVVKSTFNYLIDTFSATICQPTDSHNLERQTFQFGAI